ncbi:hypothetical protein [Nonomuraea sp. NPDC050643]|uniref:hypothetical protein n=1 Tax=Nonomuraea sp. NPDC050643 TaxID=3155660 RepID=UPI003409A021
MTGPDAKLYAAVLRRTYTRGPDATPESLSAALQTRAPEPAVLYEVAGPELERLAVGNAVLQEALTEIATRTSPTERAP